MVVVWGHLLLSELSENICIYLGSSLLVMITIQRQLHCFD